MPFTDIIRPCATSRPVARLPGQNADGVPQPYRANNPATSDLMNSVTPTWQVFKFRASGTLDTNRISQTHSTYVKLV